MPSSWASRATSSHSAVRLCRSSPVVGSSRNRIRGAVDEREREVEPALHAARVAADAAVGGLGQPDALEQLARARLARSALGEALQRRLEQQVLATGEDRVERGLLERRADRRAHLRALADDVDSRRRSRVRSSAAAASSASARSSTCRRRSGRGSRRSRRARRRGRSRRRRAVPCGTRARAARPRSPARGAHRSPLYKTLRLSTIENLNRISGRWQTTAGHGRRRQSPADEAWALLRS